jgi:hypothetical protein
MGRSCCQSAHLCGQPPPVALFPLPVRRVWAGRHDHPRAPQVLRDVDNRWRLRYGAVSVAAPRWPPLAHTAHWPWPPGRSPPRRGRHTWPNPNRRSDVRTLVRTFKNKLLPVYVINPGTRLRNRLLMFLYGSKLCLKCIFTTYLYEESCLG